MPVSLEQDLKRIVAATKPRSILSISSRAPEQFDQCLDAGSSMPIEHLQFTDDTVSLDVTARHDLVLVHSTLEHLEKPIGEHLLARLRDLYAGRLLVLVPVDAIPEQRCHWSDNEMLAFGLVRVGRYPGTGHRLCLYSFDLGSYKTRPDWLNARYWANPERFGKDWW